MIRAAIDLGTVTCRLMIADVNGRLERELLREVRIVNLGMGVSKSGVLHPASIARVVACVSDYVDLIGAVARANSLESIPLTAVATSAARDAKNSEELVAALAKLGVSLNIIPGELEADLSFLGASSEFPDEEIAVVDVGGGSTEVIFGTSKKGRTFAHSFDIGCRRITEMFIRSDPPLPVELDQARGYIRGCLASIFGKQFIPRLDRVVAVAGTATSVVSIDQAMEVYDPDLVHKTVVPISTLQAVTLLLAGLPETGRAEVVGLEPKRAGVIVAGMIILECVLDALKERSFTVSESDILQGILMASSTTDTLNSSAIR